MQHAQAHECQRLAGKVLPASGWFFYASETLADLSGETPEFRVLDFYCIIWVYFLE